MVVLVHLPQDTEITLIPYLNKKETLEGLLNDGYRTWENYKKWHHVEERKNIMKTRYSGKSFKDSSTMKKPKLSFKEKIKIKR